MCSEFRHSISEAGKGQVCKRTKTATELAFTDGRPKTVIVSSIGHVMLLEQPGLPPGAFGQ